MKSARGIDGLGGLANSYSVKGDSMMLKVEMNDDAQSAQVLAFH